MAVIAEGASGDRGNPLASEETRMPVRPQDILRLAKQSEADGDVRAAAARYVTLSTHYRRSGKKEKAQEFLEKALELNPQSPRIYLQLAIQEEEAEEDNRAKKEIEQFARLVVEQKKLIPYEAYVEKNLKPYPRLRELFYRNILELDRTQSKYFLRLAEALSQQQKIDEAKNALLDALETDGATPTIVGALVAFFDGVRNTAALEHLDRFQREKLDQSDLLILLRTSSAPAETAAEEDFAEKDLGTLIGELETKLGTPSPTKDTVEPLVREFRKGSRKVLANDSKGRIDLATAFIEMELLQHAEEELRQIPDEDAHYLEAQGWLACVLTRQGRDLAAMEVYQHCLRDERLPAAARAECLYQVLRLLLHFRDWEAARPISDELEELSPGYRQLKDIKEEIEKNSKSTSQIDTLQRVGTGRRKA